MRVYCWQLSKNSIQTSTDFSLNSPLSSFKILKSTLSYLLTQVLKRAMNFTEPLAFYTLSE